MILVRFSRLLDYPSNSAARSSVSFHRLVLMFALISATRRSHRFAAASFFKSRTYACSHFRYTKVTQIRRCFIFQIVERGKFSNYEFYKRLTGRCDQHHLQQSRPDLNHCQHWLLSDAGTAAASMSAPTVSKPRSESAM